MVDQKNIPTLESKPEQANQAAQGVAAKVQRPFKPAAADALSDNKKKLTMAAAALIVVAVGGVYLSGVTHKLDAPKPQFALEVEPVMVASTDFEILTEEAVSHESSLEEAFNLALEDEVPMVLAGLDPQIEKQIQQEEMAAMESTSLGLDQEGSKLLLNADSDDSSAELMKKVDQLIASTATLQGEIKSLRTQVTRLSRASEVPAPAAPLVALTILEVDQRSVVVSDGSARRTVKLGERLPGGAIFMGYDQATKQMRTDRGTVQIPG